MVPTVMGLMLGLVGALAVSRSLAAILYEVKPTEPVTFAGVVLMVLLVALLTCWLPIRRAAQTNPVEILRYE